ncbi:predicted hydrolases of the HAD superfamily ['Chrysanthemum coronarium' phytoplasma]|nr:predicted hydrolases of the HAD superfamily ['Chrysanthemum coronarium' phytoplasma]
MKKLFFFDIDQTLYNGKTKEIPSQTTKLLQTLAKKPNNILEIATGRSYKGLSVLKELTSLFKYFVVLNGVITWKATNIVQQTCIPQELVIKLNCQAQKKGIIVLNVSLEEKDITQTTDPDSKSLFDNVMLQKKSHQKQSSFRKTYLQN